MTSVQHARRLLGLVLPVVFPSWRFFERVGASPRIEVLKGKRWQPVLPPPTQLAPMAYLARLVWNPTRNEALFLVALAERALSEPDGPGHELLRARLEHRYGPIPYRIWLHTGTERDLAYESPAR
ncbi:MAG: hypothetical protein AAFW64_06215 [Pseudomonadota bacterium]